MIADDGLPDDRITCAICAHFKRLGKCIKYAMSTTAELQLRCVGFDPNKAQQDRRNGAQRWPTMRADIEEARKLDRERGT